jgi:beta-ketodecanoyl-[acyl-carrier-protein] synthase
LCLFFQLSIFILKRLCYDNDNPSAVLRNPLQNKKEFFSMSDIVISGTGTYIPEQTITNEELVASYNQYIADHNQRNAKAIGTGAYQALKPSDATFIEQASGIKQRHVLDKQGILDPHTLHPLLQARGNEEPSLQCDMAIKAACEALANAGKIPADIDMVLVACSNMQRSYPAMAIEIQAALGIDNGFAYDMNVACSSASFGISCAYNAITSGQARCVLLLSPEIYTGHLNFKDRKSHFIFGDACSAVIIEQAASCTASHLYRIVGCKLQTKFSNNIRNNFGFLNRCEGQDSLVDDKLFMQNGCSVRQQVVPMVINHILDHLAEASLTAMDIKRLWLHQANLQMITSIAAEVLGRQPTSEELPLILDEYGNTGAASVILTFHQHHRDLQANDYGVICSFGAGYAAGSVVVQKL